MKENLTNCVTAGFSGQVLMSFDLGLLNMMWKYYVCKGCVSGPQRKNAQQLDFIMTSQHPVIKEESTLFTPGDQ